MKAIKQLFGITSRKPSKELEREEIRRFIKQEIKQELDRAKRMDKYLKRIK